MSFKNENTGRHQEWLEDRRVQQRERSTSVYEVDSNKARRYPVIEKKKERETDSNERYVH